MGQPNDHVLRWVDEYLYYYTTYGMRQVLNINPGTVLAGYLLHKLGMDNEFKISRLHGQRQPLRCPVDADRRQAVLARRRHLPADRLQLGNSVNNETIEITAQVRRALGFEDVVRFEHHITET